MTNTGFPPPLSSARREREAARVIDLRHDIDQALEELDAALEEAIAASRQRHPSAYKAKATA
ncbi:MAG TPA: hypothetical protein VMY88_00040 [Acidimicrobiales bacterium]|nr:hypothetical protein [Acidimicrobiales bacterium]